MSMAREPLPQRASCLFRPGKQRQDDNPHYTVRSEALRDTVCLAELGVKHRAPECVVCAIPREPPFFAERLEPPNGFEVPLTFADGMLCYRAVEGEIFRLGMCLEELKDGIDRAVESQTSPQNCFEPPSSSRCLPTLGPEAQVSSPTPSTHAPVPALRTPYPEVSFTLFALSFLRFPKQGGSWWFLVRGQ